MPSTKRQAIEEAALKLFAIKGIDGTTTREIAMHAKTAEGNIYRHFKNKEELIHRVFDHGAEQFHATLVRTAAGQLDPVDRLGALVRGIFDFAEENPESFALLLTAPQSSFAQSRDENWRPLPMQLFVETLESGFATGVFRKINPVLATGWIVAMTQRAVVMSRTHLLSISRPDLIWSTIDAALRVLKPDGRSASTKQERE